MKRLPAITFSLLLLVIGSVLPAGAQRQRTVEYGSVRLEVTGTDTMVVVDLNPIYVFPRRMDTRQYARLIQNLKIVYPIAVEARQTLKAMEEHLLTLKTKREQSEYVKSMEKILKVKYTPVLKKMTFSQGKILIKLIDRETDHSSYELVKELRGGFTAFFWQGIARLFGANLKDRYDKEGEDKIIEKLILMYEAGQL